MKPKARDASRYIRSLTGKQPEQFPALPDPTDFDREMQRSKCYLPTPEQIAAACEKIQREWNDVERARRRGIRKGDEDAWHLPTVGDPEMSDDGL